MLKRISISVLTVLLAFAFTVPSARAAEENKGLQLAASARSAILIDEDTGTVLFEKNSHEKLPMASITKVMTMLLIMEALDRGEIKMDTKIRTSEYAASMGGSQIFLEPGEEMSVSDMLKGIAMASGNDATVAMAEHLAGTEEAFVKQMNERAEQLGLKDTHFVNTNGLPAPEHYSSAHDIAIMSRELLKHEEITKFTSAYQDYLRKDSPKPFWLVNTNKLVRFYTGADGLKTGYTAEAKYCLTATAKRGTLRVISVVMGEPDIKSRNAEVSQMLDYAFNHYINKPIFKAGDLVGQLSVEKGAVTTVPVKAPNQFSVLMKKGENDADYRHEVIFQPGLQAPLTKGQLIGKVVVYKKDQEVASMELALDQSIEEASWWTLFKRTSRSMFFVK